LETPITIDAGGQRPPKKLASLLGWLRVSRGGRAPRAWRAVLYWSVVALAVLVFFRGASAHALAVNREAGKDQGSYIVLARQMLRTHSIAVDGARPPLYPALIALASDGTDDRKRFFLQARAFTSVLALAAWLGFLFVLRRSLRPFTALAVWLAVGFTLWMFYAPYVKAEALFFAFSSSSFMLMLEQIQKPSFGKAILVGVVSGLAQLLKASLAPALWLFALVQACVVASELLRRRGTSRSPRVPLRRAGATLLVVATFLVTLLPYLVTNARVFGRPFYNVNSDFYMWYDSWGESGRGTRGHGDRKGFPDLPPSKLPSATKYLERHGVAHVVERLERGAVGLGSRAVSGPGFLPVTLLALVAGALSFGARRRRGRALRAYFPLALFCGGYFAGYLLLYCWFFAINPGLRFVAALVGPAIFVGGCLADRGMGRGVVWRSAFPLLLIGALLALAPGIVTGIRTWSSAGW
jgi:hypothetical protein